MAGADGDVLYEEDGGVATITLNRPQSGNALTLEMARALSRATRRAEDSAAVHVMIVTGAGDDFCRGSEPDAGPERLLPGEVDELFPDPTKRHLSGVTKPIVCAVDGACLGAGMDLMLGTDLRIASERAEFGLPDVGRGRITGGGASVLLPLQTSWTFAMEMLLTGKTVSAASAYEHGLVNDVVPVAQLLTRARALATVVASNGPVAVRASKQIVGRTRPLETPLVLEAAVYRRVMRSTDATQVARPDHDRDGSTHDRG